jgi:hypothetical protein
MQGRTTAAVVVLAVAVGLAMAAPAMAEDVTITTTGDGPGTCTSTSCTTIREAFSVFGEAAGPDTIHVPAGVTQLTAALGAPGGMTIVGAGAGATTIQAAANDRVFVVNGGTVSFSGLTMNGGTEPDTSGGGTLRVAISSTVALDHVRITGGSATTGGGIFNEGATSLTIDKSLIDGNAAQGVGGGIESQGGVSTPSSLRITDTTITGNTAGSGGGGRRSDQ